MSTKNLGVKILDTKNWNEPDIPFFTNGLQSEDWIGLVIQPTLNPAVPKEIQTLFEVARATFAYAWYYMPLTQVGADQCHRVVEAAVRERCKQASIPIANPNKKGRLISTRFVDNIEALAKHGVVTDATQLKRLDITRRQRNAGSHPEFQTIMPPALIVSTLKTTADTINALFP